MTLRNGFTLGDWTVYPLEGRLVREQGEQRLQPKTMDVLLCLAEGGGLVVQRDEILRQVWGERAQSDEPLTRCIGELRRALGDARTEPEYILTIPKRGYRLLKEAVPLGSEQTAEGAISSSADEDPRQLTPVQRRLRLDTVKKIAIFVALLVIAALIEVIVERVIEDTEIELIGDDPSDTDVASGVAPDTKSIAVLPFVNLSGDAEQEYFSDGISEEMLNLLGRVPDLRVISRTSAFSYKSRNVDLPTIARELSVAHVLEGSVRRDGDRVRITAQLIDARSDSHLWSESYERTLDNIFAIQDEIAASVVDKLKITLMGNAPTLRATDPQAYALFLQARHLSRQGTVEAYEQSSALYRQVLEIDPNFTAAWNGLADNYSNEVGKALRHIDEGHRLARAAAENALAIDPDFAPAHTTLGWIAMTHDRDLPAAARHYQRALTLQPTDIAIIGDAAALLRMLGRLKQAIALNQYVNARDPVNPIEHANLGTGYSYAGRWDEAISSYRTALRLSPGIIGVHTWIGKALLLKGEPEAAIEAVRQEAFEAWRLVGLSLAHHALGQREAADAVLAELIDKYAQDAAYNIAYVFAYRDESDRAFEWLEKAVEYHDPGLSEIAIESLFRNIHDDPRWMALLERIGKSPEQLEAIQFHVALPE